MKPPIDQWAAFLSHEKLVPSQIAPEYTVRLLELCERLAAIRPAYKPQWGWADTMANRVLIVNTAMDMGFDLMAVKKRKNKFGGTKPAMGRGLLDVWVAEYAKRFGSAVGTSAEAELRRRKIVTKIAQERPRHVPKPQPEVKS